MSEHQFPDIENQESESAIYFYQEDISFELKQPKIVLNWLEQLIDEENKTLGILNFIFCSDAYLLKINIEHLDHNYYTDVISFPYSESKIEGDIFISIDRIKDNATLHKVSFENELFRVMAHGVLHFIGFNDKSEDEKSLMTSMENKYLQRISALVSK